MALWGNNDNVPYLYNGAVGGTVSLDYDTAKKAISKKQEMPKPKKADDAGARARRLIKRKEHQSKVSVIVPPELED